MPKPPHECGDEPAFPTSNAADLTHFYGMGLRDYLAAHALGLTEYACDLAYNEHEAGVPCNPAAHAEAAYRIADAMLAERKK